MDDQAKIQVGYHSEEYGGQSDYTYQPNILLTAKSENIYTNGPEAVVEQYLKNFPDAVTAVSYTHLDVYKRQSMLNEYEKKNADFLREQELEKDPEGYQLDE